MSFGITFGDNIANFIRQDAESSPNKFDAFLDQGVFAFFDALASGGLAGLKQAVFDDFTSQGSSLGYSTQLFDGLTNKDLTRIVIDAFQKLASGDVKTLMKPYGHGIDSNIN